MYLLRYLLLRQEVVVVRIADELRLDGLPPRLAHLVVVADGDGGEGDVADVDLLRVEGH